MSTWCHSCYHCKYHMLSLIGIDAHTKPDEHIEAIQPHTRNILHNLMNNRNPCCHSNRNDYSRDWVAIENNSAIHSPDLLSEWGVSWSWGMLEQWAVCVCGIMGMSVLVCQISSCVIKLRLRSIHCSLCVVSCACIGLICLTQARPTMSCIPLVLLYLSRITVVSET